MGLQNFTKTLPLDFEQAVVGSNPHYNLGDEYKRNCQRCVVAFEMRRRGYHVVAMPNPYKTSSGTTKHRVFSGRECFWNAQRNHFIDRLLTSQELQQEFIKSFRTRDVNSRWAISWVHPNAKMSHIIVGEIFENKIEFADPQIGKIGGETLLLANPVYGYIFFRMDNLALKESFEWTELVKQESHNGCN